MKKFLEEAVKFIRINSETTRGNEELANYVLGLMQERGMKASLQQVTHSLEDISKRQFNVIGIFGDPLVDKKIKKGLLLNTHLDTVSPGLSDNWTETQKDPFGAVIRDGKIYGLGSADVKLDFLCKLYAVAKFREKKLKMPIYLVGTCGEEIGMFGAKYLIKSGVLNPKYVMVGEPSDLNVVYAHKCLNIFRVTLGYQQVERDARGFNRRIDLHSNGKSAHGSYPDLGVNAIHSTLDFLRLASERGFEFRFTQFDGGDSVNKVPDHAMTRFFLPSRQFEDFKRFFREVATKNSDERSFRADLGGAGEAGVRFLPEAIFPCLNEVVSFFQDISREFLKIRDESYNPAFSTMNFGRMKQTPGAIQLHFDLRMLPTVIPEDVEKHIQNGIKQIAASFPNLNLSVVRERMNPALNMTIEHELTQHCAEALVAAGLEKKFTKKATSTEAAQYFSAGYESVVFGPGKSQGNSHSPNEHNLLEHLEKACFFYEKLIERTCL